MIVVDASVAVKWFFPEQGSDAAQAVLLGADKLMAPALIRVEVAAAITRKVRLSELLSQEAEAACDLWFRALSTGVVTLSPDQDDLPAAVTLARVRV
jgi:predicted nucleic acid-binding protein